MACLQEGTLMLALLVLAVFLGTATAQLRWPTDSQLRASLLQKRGLGLYDIDRVSKLQFTKVRSAPTLASICIAELCRSHLLPA